MGAPVALHRVHYEMSGDFSLVIVRYEDHKGKKRLRHIRRIRGWAGLGASNFLPFGRKTSGGPDIITQAQ